jgi:hypothetical protein
MTSTSTTRRVDAAAMGVAPPPTAAATSTDRRGRGYLRSRHGSPAAARMSQRRRLVRTDARGDVRRWAATVGRGTRSAISPTAHRDAGRRTHRTPLVGAGHPTTETTKTTEPECRRYAGRRRSAVGRPSSASSRTRIAAIGCRDGARTPGEPRSSPIRGRGDLGQSPARCTEPSNVPGVWQLSAAVGWLPASSTTGAVTPCCGAPSCTVPGPSSHVRRQTGHPVPGCRRRRCRCAVTEQVENGSKGVETGPKSVAFQWLQTSGLAST